MKKALFTLALLFVSLCVYTQNTDWHSSVEQYVSVAYEAQDNYEYDKAIDYFQKALIIVGNELGITNEVYTSLQTEIGNCFHEKAYSEVLIGDINEGIALFQNALSYYADSEGKGDSIGRSLYALTLCDIGDCFMGIGEYVNALNSFEYALRLDSFKTDVSANALHGMAMQYERLGQYSTALDSYYKALNELKSRGKRYTRDYCRYMEDVGVCLYAMGRYDDALNQFKQVIRILEIVDNGKNGADYAHTLSFIGSCFYERGQYEQAQEYIKAAADLIESMPEHSVVEDTIYDSILFGYAQLQYEVGTRTGISNARKILKKISESSINDSSTFIYLEGLIAQCDYYLGDAESSSKGWGNYIRDVSFIIGSNLSGMSELRRQVYWGKYSHLNDDFFFFAEELSTPEMNKAAYDCALFSKGLLLNTEIEMRKLILESGDEGALRMYEEMRGSRAYLDKLYENPEGKKYEIDSLNNLLEAQQRELAKRSKEFGDYSRNLTIKWEDVKNALGKRDIAIEFATYTSQDTTFYIALTLKCDYPEPHLVELFNDKELERSNPAGAAWYSQTESTDLIWGNLVEELKGVDNVYFSPAGELNNIAIEYLLDEDGKHLLSEKRNYYRLSSTRELVKTHKAQKAEEAVVYGGIYYDATPKSRLTGEESETVLLAKAASRQYMLDSLSRNRGEKWDYLPGTKKEAESIVSTLRKNKVRNELFEGEVATEESFKALDGAKKDIIHIATHGFYYTERDARKRDDLAFMMNDENRAPKEDKMMTRSGLLFAGAKNTFEGKEIPRDVEDGIVTAKDISRMDLRGCDLAVLSACQSGLGDITGDGVFGLQRGFKKAGVQTLVMSLWKVDDDVTRIMMTRFYQNMLKGKSKYEAFKDAQSYLRKKYNDPYYYAAFILLDAKE